MIFSSYAFIFLFFPIVFAGYWLLQYHSNDRLAKWWLILSAMAFYAFGNVIYAPILMVTVVFNFFLGKGILNARKKGNEVLPKIFLGLSFLENLGLLFWFKYYNFFIENVNFFIGTDFLLKNIILPLGISFYTFPILSYVVEHASRMYFPLLSK